MTTKMEVFMAAATGITMVAAVVQLVIAWPTARPVKAKEITNWRGRRILEQATIWWLFVLFFTGLYHFMFRVVDPTTTDIANFGVCVFSGSVGYGLVIAKIVLKKNVAKHRELQAKIDDLESRWARSIQMHSPR